jgi:N-acetylneuraminate synthase
MYFIAEIGVNHEAKLSNAYKCIRDAKHGGAHAIKLQCYKAEKIASKYARSYWGKKVEKESSQYKLYKRFDKFKFKDYKKIYNYCKRIKIDFIVTPFDVDSVKFFKNKVKYFKISSSDITNLPLIEKIALTKKPVILSTGASTKKEIGTALNILRRKCKKIILLHCILNYPTRKINANLNMINDIKEFGFPVGLSDHTIPKDSQEILIFAYIMGVRIIEKHFTFNKKKKGNDHFHSFDKKDLKLFFKKIKKIDPILGRKKKIFLSSEKISRKHARRSIFYNNNISKNTLIKKKDLIMLRPANGINPFKYKELIGRKIKYDRFKGDIAKFSDFV